VSELAPQPGSDLLARIDRWGADTAAAGVVDRSGTIASHGPVDEVLAVASITKLLTALTVLLAVEEGTIALTDEVGRPGCTVRHLLAHAGGFDFDTKAVLAPVGTRRTYSNTAYELLGAHLEQRSAMAFGDYLTEGILGPLGMDSTELRGTPAAGLWSSVRDLTRFVAELLSPTLLAPETMAAYATVQYPDLAGVLPGWGRHDPCPWGLGPEIRGSKEPHWMGSSAPPETYGHFGGSGTFLWVEPGRAMACIVLTDRTFGDWAIREWPSFSDAVRARFR
jgi:CubicO group peptidase (beta-lactamase class C family)